MDTLQLADVIENFCEVCREHFGLDPSWYYTAPGLAWNACLKITNQTLMLLPDLDVVHMIEKGIRGGVAMTVTRYAEANNKYMKNWQKSLPSVFLAYFDANNLYGGYAMSQKLPTDGFA